DGEKAGFDFIQQLLQIFLMRRAIRFEDDSIDLRELSPGPRFSSFHLSLNDRQAERQRHRWNPYRATTQKERVLRNSFTAGVVAKYFDLDLGKDAKQVDDLLLKIWDSLRHTVLVEAGHAGEFQIDESRIVLTSQRQWRICETCGRLTVFELKGKCALPTCEG